MTKGSRLWALALSFLIIPVLGAEAQSRKSGATETLLTIGGKQIPADEFIYLYRKNHRQNAGEFTEEKIEEYLDLFIRYKLKVAEAVDRGMDTTAKFRQEYQTYREELLKPYLPDTHVVDSLVRLTYDRLKEEVNASHILINLPEDAPPDDTLKAFQKITALRDRALRGEDFGDLAARFSDEPGAERTQGNLGFFTAMQMVFPFEQAAYLTPVGEVSKPVRTRFGYHILKVLDRQPARGEVEISHIMIRTGEQEARADARNTIFDIHDKLRQGVDWNELVAQYSDDPNSRDKGGRLRPFGVGAMASVPEFEDMAFSLQTPGEISDPFQTRFGWHILRLESKIPLPDFDELKAPLTQRVSRDERVSVSREALQEKLRKQFSYSEQPGVLDSIRSSADELLTPGDGPHSDRVLFTLQGNAYRVKDFAAFVRERPRDPAQLTALHVDNLFDEFVSRALTRLLEEKVKRESPDYRWLLKEYYEGILLFEIMEKEVWNRAMEDSAGQRSYFESHAQQYTAGERIAGTIYSSADAAVIEALRERLANGDTAVAEFVAENRIREDSGIFEKDSRAVLGQIEWKPGIYVRRSGDLHALVAVDRLVPPGPQTFQEARAAVITDYQTFLEDSWIRELKRKFGVKLNKKARKRAFSQLISE